MKKVRVWSVLGLVAALAVVLAVSVSSRPAVADKGYSLQGQGQGAEKRHDTGEFLDLFGVGGVVFTDANADVVTVGVDRSERCNAVKQKGKALGIDSLVCEVASPIESLATPPTPTLQDSVRPVQGGLQIAFQANGSGYFCTLGFNAVRLGVAGFVTNSHCTSTYGSVDGTKHYQPTIAEGNLIGTEIVDPPFLKGNGCPKFLKCRYSDSAFSQRTDGALTGLGLIEKTDGVNNGSLKIAGSFQIVGEAATNASVGYTLNKVGRTTGWTQGPVTKSCVHTTSSGTVLRCQDFVDADVYNGDSGSPVFGNPNGNNVQLHGILWGGTDCNFWTCQTLIYSPMANIQQPGDLGPLNTCAGAPC